MSMRSARLAMFLLLGAATPVAVSRPSLGQSAPPAMPAMPATPIPTDAATAAKMDAMSKMMRAMSAPPTGDPDRDFVTMMMPHHQGAIDMADIELKYGKDPTLRAMATGIVAAQEKEIAEMRDWQTAHPKP